MKKMVRKVLALAAAVATVVSLSSCAKDTSNEFRVGLECGYPPFNWTQATNENGAVEIAGSKEFANGYDIQMAKKVADGLGKKLVVVKTEWDGLVPALQSKKIDGIIAGMSPTAERKETIDFSDHYYRSELVLIVKKGSKYENAKELKDFAGAKVTGQQNTFHYSVIDQIDGVQKQSAMVDFPSMRVALESGMIDAYVGERPEGISVMAARDDFAVVQFEEGKGFDASDDDVAVAVGLRKEDTQLKTDINKVLSGISEETRQQMMDDAIKNQPASEE